MNLKLMALQLCTCTWIEIMTGAGITLYLLYLQNYYLAALTAGVFAPLIGFHFAIDKLSKDRADWEKDRLIRIRPSKYKLVD
jgi:hypothetical protein